METVQQVLAALARRYAFREVAALIADGAGGDRLTVQKAAQVQQLCAFGQRLLDLDAEDFGAPDPHVDSNTDSTFTSRVTVGSPPSELLTRALACRVPQSAHEPDRGALGSLRPPFRLLLEVIAAHWQQHKTAALVATVHLASEYLPLLVWETTLRHAGDPLLLPPAVTGDGSAWGHTEDRDCPHSGAQKAAANRVLHVAQENSAGWRNYLDRQHSLVAVALEVCAGACKRPCTVFTRYSAPRRGFLEHGCRTALGLSDSAIVRLRHQSPVGHGFGVPSPREVSAAWQETRARLGKHEPAVLVDDGFPLPGLPSLFSALAGVPLVPDTLLADTAFAVVEALS